MEPTLDTLHACAVGMAAAWHGRMQSVRGWVEGAAGVAGLFATPPPTLKPQK